MGGLDSNYSDSSILLIGGSWDDSNDDSGIWSDGIMDLGNVVYGALRLNQVAWLHGYQPDCQIEACESHKLGWHVTG